MIPVAFSTDHNFVMPTGVTIASLLLYSPHEAYDIFVLTACDVTPTDKDKLSLQVSTLSPQSKITFIGMEDRFEGGYEIRGISRACYYRLMIPWLIPHIDKIIYCDVDIIFKTSLADLYQTDLEGLYVAGATPFREEAWRPLKKYFDSINLDYRKYINSGVLIINSKLQREARLDETYESMASQRFLYQDQDIINIVCKEKIGYFDRKYNLMPLKYATSNEFENDVIIHYSGDKPWRDFTYAWAEWWDVYNKSLFHDGNYYHEISGKILSHKYRLSLIKRKSKEKTKQFIYKLTGKR